MSAVTLQLEAQRIADLENRAMDIMCQRDPVLLLLSAAIHLNNVGNAQAALGDHSGAATSLTSRDCILCAAAAMELERADEVRITEVVN